MGGEAVRRALSWLGELDLVAYRPFSRHASEGFRQVLSLPEDGPAPIENMLSADSD